jgi:hypothetical protein
VPRQKGNIVRAAEGPAALDSGRSTMAMRDITEMMNIYRECSRNLWNVYFSKMPDYGSASDAFDQIRDLLFEALVANELSCEGDAENEDSSPPLLKVVPNAKEPLLVKRLTESGMGNYWDQERDLFVGPDDVILKFIDYLSFSTEPFIDYNFYRCSILEFPSHIEYEGREALLRSEDGRVFHEELSDDSRQIDRH